MEMYIILDADIDEIFDVLRRNGVYYFVNCRLYMYTRDFRCRSYADYCARGLQMRICWDGRIVIIKSKYRLRGLRELSSLYVLTKTP